MLKGQFDEDGQPTFSVTLAGLLGEVTLIGIVDTGFDGDLCIPVPTAVSLGLQLKATKFVEFADGRVEEEFVFRGTVTMGDLPPRSADIELTFSDQALIGSGLFQGLKEEFIPRPAPMEYWVRYFAAEAKEIGTRIKNHEMPSIEINEVVYG